MFRLSAGVFNNGMLDYPDKRDEYSFSLLILSNLITVVFCGILLGAYPFLRQWIGLDWPLMFLMVVVFLFQPAYNLWTARQRYELKYKLSLLWAVVRTILYPLAAIMCILLFNDQKVYARLFGSEVTLIVIYAGFYVYLGIKSEWKLETKYWKEAFLFNLPLLPHYFSMYALSSADRLMISHMVSDSATAYYSIANSVATVASVIWSAINATLIPYTYEKCKKKEYDAVSSVATPILGICAIGCVLVIMLAPEVVAIVATAEYKEAIYAIPPIVGGVFFQIHYGLYSNFAFYYKKPKYVMVGTVVSAGLNLILNYVFIQRFGYIAAGYTTLVCYLVQAAIDYWAMLKSTGGVKVYNMKYIGSLSLAIIVIAVGSNFLYVTVFIRYAIIFLLALVVILLRRKIFATIKTMREK